MRCFTASIEVADLDYRAVIFGNLDKNVWRQQASHWMIPAQQRFGADEARAAQIDDRLVQQHQLARMGRAVQRRAQFHTFDGRSRRGRIVETELVTADPLGGIHGGIGVAQQRRGVAAVTRIAADADAGRHEDLAAVDHNRFRQGHQDPARDDGQVQIIVVHRREDCELIAAQPHHRVVAALTLQETHRHRAQQLVATCVPEHIVDLLEAVEVQHQQTDLPPAGVGVRQCRRQAIFQPCAIGQIGQRIEECQLPDLFPVVDDIGDIAPHCQHRFRPSSLSGLRNEPDRRPSDIAVWPVILELRFAGRRGPQRHANAVFVVELSGRRADLRCQRQAKATAARNLPHRGVGVDDLTPPVVAGNEIGRVLDQRSEKLLVLMPGPPARA
jgi:hypothetical protein